MDDESMDKLWWMGQFTEKDKEFISAQLEDDAKMSQELQDVLEDISNVERVCNEYQSHLRYANRLMVTNTVNCVLGIIAMIVTTMIGCNYLLFNPERVKTLQNIIFVEAGVFIVIPAYTIIQWVTGKIAERMS